MMPRGASEGAWEESTELEPRRGSIGLSGLIDGDVAALFLETLASLQLADAPVLLELSRARIDEDAIARVMADAIGHATLRLGQVRIVGAPSALRRALAAEARDPRVVLE